jgi:preprotein translocase subunit SecE
MAMLGRKDPAQQTKTKAPVPRKDGRAVSAGASANEKPSRIDKLREQLRNVMAELRKVTWPTRDETRNLTLVVLGLTTVLGTALYVLDLVLSWLYRLPR